MRSSGMRMAVLGVLTLSALLVFCRICSASTVVTFKDEALVKGPMVTLSDVADVDGDGAPTLVPMEITVAAPPGNSRLVNVAMLESRIRAIGGKLENLEFQGAKSVNVTTMHQTITRERLEEELGMFIEHQLPWDPANCDIKIEPVAQDVVVPAGEALVEWQTSPGFRYLGQGTFKGNIKVDGVLKRAVLCRATIDAYSEVVVATRLIERGHKIGLSDLVTERRALSTVRDEHYENPAELLGLMLRSSVAPGQVVTRRSVVAPYVVKRLQVVAVETNAGGLRIQSEARAQGDGAAGDVITCQNIDSKQEFQGVVRKDGVVVVE